MTLLSGFRNSSRIFAPLRLGVRIPLRSAQIRLIRPIRVLFRLAPLYNSDSR
jgi:hypothetical protein